MEKRYTKVVSIINLKPLQKARIAYVKGDKKIIQRLSDLGLTPKSEVMLIRKINGPIEISVRRTSLAIAREIARKIFVKP